MIFFFRFTIWTQRFKDLTDFVRLNKLKLSFETLWTWSLVYISFDAITVSVETSPNCLKCLSVKHFIDISHDDGLREAKVKTVRADNAEQMSDVIWKKANWKQYFTIFYIPSWISVIKIRHYKQADHTSGVSVDLRVSRRGAFRRRILRSRPCVQPL